MPTSEDQRPIIVRSFPASDREFADATGDALQKARAERAEEAGRTARAESAERPDPPATTLHEVVERRIRAAYRNARIHVQDELADLGMQEIVWYAYRDGRIRDPDPSRERLYAAVASARRTVRESKTAIDHARRAARGARYDDDSGQTDGPTTAHPDET